MTEKGPRKMEIVFFFGSQREREKKLLWAMFPRHPYCFVEGRLMMTMNLKWKEYISLDC